MCVLQPLAFKGLEINVYQQQQTQNNRINKQK